MSSDYKDKRKYKTIRFLHSFKHAAVGIATVIKEERNMKIHLILGFIVVVLGFVFDISRMEWILVLLSIGGVISLEAVNSAIERVVDLVTEEHHPLAKNAKDMAAAAVFLFAIVTILVGVLIFVPKLLF